MSQIFWFGLLLTEPIESGWMFYRSACNQGYSTMLVTNVGLSRRFEVVAYAGDVVTLVGGTFLTILVEITICTYDFILLGRKLWSGHK